MEREIKSPKCQVDANTAAELIVQQDQLNGFTAIPPKRGLYNPENEREACGVGFIVSIDGIHTHKVRKMSKVGFKEHRVHLFEYKAFEKRPILLKRFEKKEQWIDFSLHLAVE